MNIKEYFKGLVIKTGLNKAKKKSSILKEVFDNPENIKLEAYIEGEEIIVKLKKKAESK